MAFDYLNNIYLYNAPLKIVGKFAQRISETGLSRAKCGGIQPLAYNKLAWGIYTASNFNDLHGPQIPVSTNQFKPNIPSGYWWYNQSGFSNGNTMATTFRDWDNSKRQIVIYFTWETVREYKNRLGVRTAKDMKIIYGTKYNKQMIGAAWAEIPYELTGTMYASNNGVIIPTDEYDDYVLLKSQLIYINPANSEIVARTSNNTTSPVYNIYISSVELTRTNPGISLPLTPGIMVEFNDLIQIPMLGISYVSSVGHLLSYYSIGTHATSPFISNGFISTAFLNAGVFDLSNAVLLNSVTQTSQFHTPSAYDMDISNCPMCPNYTNYTLIGTMPQIDPPRDETFTRFVRNGAEYLAYSDFYHSTATTPVANQYNCICAFKSVDDIVAYYNDWGVKATDNETIARYGDYDEIPDFGIGASDDGGNIDPNNTIIPTGYPITSIPQDKSDRIDDFKITTPNVTAANLCNNYIYDLSQIRELFNWTCTEDYIDNLSDLFTDKLSAIYGIIQYPFDFLLHDSAHIISTPNTTIINVVNENLPAHSIISGYNTIIHGGEFTYISYYGNFNDWINCAYCLYIPYAGVIEIPASAVVNKRLTVDYCVDIMTGNATAIVKSFVIGSPFGALVKTVPCQMGMTIPVQSSNYQQAVTNQSLSAISMIGGALGKIVSGNIGGGLADVFGMPIAMTQNAISNRIEYSTSGNVSTSTGACLPQIPYLCIRRAQVIDNPKHKTYSGLPTWFYSKISDIPATTNITQFENVWVTSATALENEISEIEKLLRGGVYL